MRVVVTGATGFVGRPLVRALLDAGHAVTAWTRDPARAAEALPAACAVARWDGAAAAAGLRAAHAVVHLAGAGIAERRWTAAHKRAVHESRVAGTRALVRGIAALPPAERPQTLVGASAIGWYGDRGDEVLDESSPPGRGFLPDVCRAWEAETLAARDLGLRVVVLRTGVVLGARGGALRAMLPPFRLGVGGRLGSGRQWMSWIHLDDLVGLYRFALEHAALGGVVNAVAPAPVTNAEFTRALARALGRPAVLPVPALALRVALGEASALLLESQRVLPAAARAAGFAFRHPELSGALADLASDLDEELVREQIVPRPPAEVFRFFADPRNLARITPDFLGFRVLRTSTAELRAGTTIDYRLSLHGVPVRWRSVIEEWQPDRRFVDRQVRGPYRTWVHTHEFEPHEGGTLVRDRVRYALPLAPLGELVAGAFVGRDLERIFAYRRERLRELLGRGGASAAPTDAPPAPG
jgi:uncharacterized protein (TIGR01777 family)